MEDFNQPAFLAGFYFLNTIKKQGETK